MFVAKLVFIIFIVILITLVLVIFGIECLRIHRIEREKRYIKNTFKKFLIEDEQDIGIRKATIKIYTESQDEHRKVSTFFRNNVKYIENIYVFNKERANALEKKFEALKYVLTNYSDSFRIIITHNGEKEVITISLCQKEERVDTNVISKKIQESCDVEPSGFEVIVLQKMSFRILGVGKYTNEYNPKRDKYIYEVANVVHDS